MIRRASFQPSHCARPSGQVLDDLHPLAFIADRQVNTGLWQRRQPLELTCWNGEVVRVASALDCHDCEAIGWVATTAGVSGEMIRDIMVQRVEKRFDAIRAPHPAQWLSDLERFWVAQPETPSR
jgi:transposase InsO family protein